MDLTESEGSRSESCAVEHRQEEDAEDRVLFNPPLYHQRYMFAVRHLTCHEVKSVVDMGCSDGSFFKVLAMVPTLEQAALLDVDHALLESKKRVINPELRHFIHRRSVPLTVSLYSGSAGDFDSRLCGLDAVTLIEVIEHLHPDTLEQVTANVFGNMRPKFCIVTTPNSEFNILFGNEDPKQFRHWDHKFEWTRQEFQLWCHEVCVKFGYSVEYSGVGYPFSDPHSLSLGPCSQAAIFSSQHDEKAQAVHRQNLPNTECYTLIATCEFPFRKDERSLEEKIDDQVQYCLNSMISFRRKEVAYGEEITIAVSAVADFSCVKSLCGIETVRESLLRGGYHLSEDKEFVVHLEDESDLSDNGSDDPSSGYHDVCLAETETSAQDSLLTENSGLFATENVFSNDSGCGTQDTWTPNMSSLSKASSSGNQDDWDLEIALDEERLEIAKNSVVGDLSVTDRSSSVTD
ncbi:small RNA 2'-O-methyltransferase [Aplysia californica]|uniref:Small RNA 2'-O-methyltransferase n=1 Tax=Aplysia californica TaxID=6500 RepID=A0ABM0K3G3_APLCA|nr:small RNA 2'-O-methyltransferase [Aplysia californica]